MTEAHFWIHQLEAFYHFAEPVRWHLNAFLKAVKEVPILLSQELQNHPGFPEWFRAEREHLYANGLLRILHKQRDFIVHQGMLIPKSSGGIGRTEGRGFKVGVSLSIEPHLDSDEAMGRYLFLVAMDGDDMFSILEEDEDSVPCVHRVWRLEPFDEELVDLAVRAWAETAAMVRRVIRWLGDESPKLTLECRCRHSAQDVQFKTYDRKILLATVERMREDLTVSGTK